MREILFRGKKIEDRNQWVFGTYKFQYNLHTICLAKPDFVGFDEHHVYETTLGQYTGLTDKNGNKIFEGDIVIYPWEKDNLILFKIEYDNGSFLAVPKEVTDDVWSFTIGGYTSKIEVVGNIYDNLELWF